MKLLIRSEHLKYEITDQIIHKDPVLLICRVVLSCSSSIKEASSKLLAMSLQIDELGNLI